MPIQPLSISEYTRIPDDEDVTPVDHTLSRNFKRTEKSVRFIVIVAVLVCVASILAFFGFHFVSIHSNNTITIYTSAKQDYLTTAATFAPKASIKVFSEIPPCSTSPTSSSSSSSSNNDYNNENDCINTIDSSEARVLIDNRVHYQTILGFGGAFTESAAINFYRLPGEIQKKVLNLYFEKKNGIGLTLGRIHINSCDFSLSSYNFDLVPDDYDLNFFDTEVTHDTQYIIPFLLDAMETSEEPIRLVASPWSPPPWMKKPIPGKNFTTMTGSATPNGLRDEPQVQLAWARYISKFITAYKMKGIDIWALTPQNEPEFPAPWEACSFNATFERDFVRDYLGPIVRTEHPELLLLAFDHNKDHLQAWTETMLGSDVDPSLSAAQFVDGMAFHWYGGNDRITDGTYGYNSLNASYHIAPNKIFLATEGCSCPDVSLGNWLRAERLAHDIIFDLLNFAQGWIDWNLLVDNKGGPNHLKNNCDASLIATENFENVILQPKYSYFGHFSKYLTPNTIRVQSEVIGNYKFESTDSNIQSGIEIAAFHCEHSARQMWSIHPTLNYIYLTIPSVSSNSDFILLCIAYGDEDRNYLRLADCSTTDPTFKLVHVDHISNRIHDKETGKCFSLADDVRESGALLQIKDCILDSPKEADSQSFSLNSSTGEIKILAENSLCLTAGWPFLTGVAALTPDGKTVTVILNDAAIATTVSIFDLNTNKMFPLHIPPSSIQTIVY